MHRRLILMYRQTWNDRGWGSHEESEKKSNFYSWKCHSIKFCPRGKRPGWLSAWYVTSYLDWWLWLDSLVFVQVISYSRRWLQGLAELWIGSSSPCWGYRFVPIYGNWWVCGWVGVHVHGWESWWKDDCMLWWQWRFCVNWWPHGLPNDRKSWWLFSLLPVYLLARVI